MKTMLAVVLALAFFPVWRAPAGRQHSSASETVRAARSANDGVSPVVVELFTSEGCSSCPPADALLAKLESTQPIAGAEIIAIEEHVDYWNHLGWADPFSSGAWTARQQEYADAFRQDGEYTPEMVVGGRVPFVGSRGDLAAKTIREASQSAAVPVSVSRLEQGKGGDGEFQIAVGKLGQLSQGDSAEVWFAITESGLASQVAGGENAGRNLRHASVLRSLRHIGTADASKSGSSFTAEVSPMLKPGWKRENLRAVVVVQEKKSRRILGAAQANVVG